MHSKTILVSCGRTITLERASALFSSMDADVRALKKCRLRRRFLPVTVWALTCS